MRRIELDVPEALGLLTEEERDRLLRSALRSAARQRAHELAEEADEALKNVQGYELKYGMRLAEYERDRLGAAEDVVAHEDYNDWFFWSQVLERANAASSALKEMEAAP